MNLVVACDDRKLNKDQGAKTGFLKSKKITTLAL
jgi:hypothetical protein